MKILVVEDDPSVRETLGMVLESYQHEPALLENGEQALDYLANRWPDVMLLDLTLPGMSGEELYERIAGRFGRVPPTVVLSAAQEGPSRVRQLAGALYLAKPYTIEDLETILCEVKSRGAA
jgi:DNA-binding response OmpR family regulator